MRAVLFCRSPRNSVRALTVQEERCRRKAAAAGAGTTVTIVDTEPDGKGLDRPAVVQLRRLLRDRLVDLVVADTPNRLPRNIADLRAIGLDISRAGVRLVFVSP